MGRVVTRGVYALLAITWVFAALCVSAKPAYAYVDPGSGLLLLQILGSTILGFTFLIRKRIAQLLRFFSRNPKVKETDGASH